MNERKISLTKTIPKSLILVSWRDETTARRSTSDAVFKWQNFYKRRFFGILDL